MIKIVSSFIMFNASGNRDVPLNNSSINTTHSTSQDEDNVSISCSFEVANSLESITKELKHTLKMILKNENDTIKNLKIEKQQKESELNEKKRIVQYMKQIENAYDTTHENQLQGNIRTGIKHLGVATMGFTGTALAASLPFTGPVVVAGLAAAEVLSLVGTSTGAIGIMSAGWSALQADETRQESQGITKQNRHRIFNELKEKIELPSSMSELDIRNDGDLDKLRNEVKNIQECAVALEKDIRYLEDKMQLSENSIKKTQRSYFEHYLNLSAKGMDREMNMRTERRNN